MAELAPTEETPFQSDPIRVQPMIPVTHAEAAPQYSYEEEQKLRTAMTPAERDAILKAYGHYAEPPAAESLDVALSRYSEERDSIGKMRRADAEVMADMANEEKARQALGRDLTAAEAAALRIRADYKTSEPPPDPNAGASISRGKPISLDETEDRMKFVSNLSQSTGNDERDKKLCGATSIVAGMVLAKGEQGVDDIIGAIESSDPDKAKQLSHLREKLAQNKPLTDEDMNDLKSGLADHLDNQLKKAQGGCNDPFGGANPQIMQDFINGNDAIKKTFKENNMSIDGVDRMGGTSLTPGVAGLGDGAPEHAILTVRDDSGKAIMVYDPNLRRSTAADADDMGPQIIQDSATLADYDAIRKDRVRALDDNEQVNFPLPECRNPPTTP